MSTDKAELNRITESTGRITGLDFARAVSAMGIFAVHYIQETGLRASVPANVIIAAQEWGFIFVTVFFIMSGVLLEMRHPAWKEGFHLIPFYKKRAASIYPMFYLVYLIVLIVWLAVGNETYSHLLRPELLFTIAGVDGYFASTFDTCYLVGEWFLGALIFLYLLFPLLSRLMKKCEPAVWGVLIVLYACFLDRPLLSQAPVTNIFSCMICFALGITFAHHGICRSKIMILPGMIALALGLLPVFRNLAGTNISSHLTGAGLFILMVFAGNEVMKRKLPGRIFGFIGGISYPFYLVHHVIIGVGLNILFRYAADPSYPWKYAPAAALILFAAALFSARIMEKILNVFKTIKKDHEG